MNVRERVALALGYELWICDRYRKRSYERRVKHTGDVFWALLPGKQKDREERDKRERGRDEWSHNWRRMAWGDQGERAVVGIPDPDDMNVVEQVVRLAIEKHPATFVHRLCVETGLYEEGGIAMSRVELAAVIQLATATPAQRLEAALRCLGV